MPMYFFHQHLNGRLTARDLDGLKFANQDEAVEHAVHLISSLFVSTSSDGNLRSNIGGAADLVTNRTHLSIEVSDGTETLSLVRGKVYVESPRAAERHIAPHDRKTRSG